jgi:hypothetical protein
MKLTPASPKIILQYALNPYVHSSQDKGMILDRCVGGNEFYISVLNIRVGGGDTV